MNRQVIKPQGGGSPLDRRLDLLVAEQLLHRCKVDVLDRHAGEGSAQHVETGSALLAVETDGLERLLDRLEGIAQGALPSSSRKSQATGLASFNQSR